MSNDALGPLTQDEHRDQIVKAALAAGADVGTAVSQLLPGAATAYGSDGRDTWVKSGTKMVPVADAVASMKAPTPEPPKPVDPSRMNTAEYLEHRNQKRSSRSHPWFRRG